MGTGGHGPGPRRPRCLRKAAHREQIRRADQLAFLGGMAARSRTRSGRLSPPSAGFRAAPGQTCPRAITAASTSTGLLLRRVDRQIIASLENLLTLAQPEPGTWQAMSLPETLGSWVRMLPPGPRLLLERVDSDAMPPVWGDPFHWPRFSPTSSRTRWRPAPEGERSVSASNGAEVTMFRVLVWNSGAGIPAELHERIFQPFFTQGAGTGLGLPIARQIVEATAAPSPWRATQKSETSFVVELPPARPS